MCAGLGVALEIPEILKVVLKCPEIYSHVLITLRAS